MKRIELTKDGKHSYVSTCGALLAEFVGTNAQGLELVEKFNQHAELVKVLQDLADYSGGSDCDPINHPCGKAHALLQKIRGGAL